MFASLSSVGGKRLTICAGCWLAILVGLVGLVGLAGLASATAGDPKPPADSSDAATQARPVLADAAEANQPQRVRAKIDQGAPVDAAQVDGMTPLHWVVYHDRSDLARLLIDAGADVAAANRYGVTPLSLANNSSLRGRRPTETMSLSNASLWLPSAVS